MKKAICILVGGIATILVPICAKAQTASVETKKPNSEYKPAFPGQTRIGAVTTKSAYEGKVLTSSLERPWGIATLPDGRFLVTEKGGNMRVVSADGTVGTPISGVPKVNSDG